MPNTDLRPMTLGEILDRTFSLYKSNFWLFVGIVALPYLVIILASLLDVLLLTSTATQMTQAGTISPSAFATAFVSALSAAMMFMIIYLFAFSAAQAATVVAVSDLYLGRTAAIHESFRRIRGRILPVLAVFLIIFLLVGAGFLFFVIPGIILLCRTAVAIPSATLEDIGPGVAISRSFHLTKDHALEIFAVLVLLFVLNMVAIFIFQAPFIYLAGSPFKPHVLPLGLTILQELASWVSGVLVAPVGTIAFSLIYYDLRIRKEAFDLQRLMTMIEPSPASAAGAGSPA